MGERVGLPGTGQLRLMLTVCGAAGSSLRELCAGPCESSRRMETELCFWWWPLTVTHCVRPVPGGVLCVRRPV